MSVEIRNVAKTFDGQPALRNVSVEIREGELLALLGPSGCGKTTLLRILAGLEAADEGVVLFEGRDVSAHPVGERRVGFVFQHYALFGNLTVFENVAFGLRVRPRRERPAEAAIRAKVEELLELIHLANFARRYPAQLSGGQRQRVALARALAIEPRVLLLDEPFGALDAKVRQGLRTWLRALHDKIKITSVLVTHDQEEALEVADRIVVMNEGRIEQTGTPDQVYHHPNSEFVMDFLGHVNLFHGRFEAGRAVFGDMVVDAARAPAPDGKTPRLLVRPHDLDLHTRRNGATALRGRVLRIRSAGAQARVEVRCETGDVVNVDMPHGRFRESRIVVGDDVFVSMRDMRLFVEDYSI